jgi:hypothetical protein
MSDIWSLDTALVETYEKGTAERPSGPEKKRVGPAEPVPTRPWF